MNLDEITLFLVILNLLVSVWSIRVLSLAIHNGLATLLSSFHETISKILEGGIGDFEPPNPIQAAIAQMLTQRVQNAPIELPRSSDGKFSGE